MTSQPAGSHATRAPGARRHHHHHHHHTAPTSPVSRDQGPASPDAPGRAGRRITLGLAGLCFAGLIATAGTAHAQATGLITSPTGADTSGELGRELARLPVADGAFSFVQMVGGDVGVVAQGARALATLRGATAGYRTTPLELYVAAGGSRSQAPAPLVEDDRLRRAAEGAVAPLPPLTAIPASSLSVLGQSDLGIVGGAACVDGPVETFAYFKSWWQGLFNIPGIGALEDIGAHGHHGVGTWTQGAANLNLGSTSAGAALVCFPSGADLDARIVVQEQIGNNLWLDLWSTQSLFSGVAYGYWFKGLVVHKVRVLIREQDPAHPGPLGPFYWAGSY